MQIYNATFEVGLRGDGSAAFILHHGGDHLRVDLSNDERRKLGRMLLEPAFVCVAAAEDVEVTA
jgi:hypothetical protein